MTILTTATMRHWWTIAICLSGYVHFAVAGKDKFTLSPTISPSQKPTTVFPTDSPSGMPTPFPTPGPSPLPTLPPTPKPTFFFIIFPSSTPSLVPSFASATVTATPTTLSPVTPAPVTPAPVTPAPVTPAPVTPAPVTPAPVTASPVTSAPITAAPTPRPTPIPTPRPTPVPTPRPTPIPTTQPTISPTPLPTPAPVTSAPVASPVTPAPVVVPTTMAPTPAPTTQPVTTTSAPAASPVSMAPSIVNQQLSVLPSSTPTGPIVGVPLPNMVITLNITDAVVDSGKLGRDIETFVNNTVSSNAIILGDLTSVDMTVIVSQVARRRRLQQEQVWASTVTGVAYFQGQVPTPGRLTDVLDTYFSSWGDDDLKDFLARDGMQISGVGISINGKTVTTNSPVSNAREPVSESTTTSPGAGLIAGLVIGCVALVVALGLIAWQRQRYNQTKGIMEDDDDDDDELQGHTVNVERKDHIPGQTITRDAEDMSFSAISLEESLYTSNTEDIFNPTQRAPDQYDAARLDKVISNAHQFVASHEDEEGGRHNNSDDDGDQVTI